MSILTALSALWLGVLASVSPCPLAANLAAFSFIQKEGLSPRKALLSGSLYSAGRTVTFAAAEWIRFESEPSADHAGGRLTISIDEPQPGALFLRFRYETTLSETRGSEDARYADIVRSAYHQSDLDTVRVIRMIIESTREQ